MSETQVVIEQDKTTIEVPAQGPPETVKSVEKETLEVADETVRIIEVGIRGPSGSEEAVAYAQRVDIATSDVIYKGEAIPGAAESASVWRISKVTFLSDGDSIKQWAGGVADFTQVWDDHLSLTYS